MDGWAFIRPTGRATIKLSRDSVNLAAISVGPGLGLLLMTKTELVHSISTVYVTNPSLLQTTTE